MSKASIQQGTQSSTGLIVLKDDREERRATWQMPRFDPRDLAQASSIIILVDENMCRKSQLTIIKSWWIGPISSLRPRIQNYSVSLDHGAMQSYGKRHEDDTARFVPEDADTAQSD